MVIRVKNLTRTFKVPKQVESKGLLEKIKNLVFTKQLHFKALDNVSFKVKKGDRFGYLGPNGAGKSTTIKILTGILTPDSGEVDCLGYTPWKDRMEYTKQIGVVFGQRSLLWWDIPVLESFLLYKDIYQVDDKDFRERLKLYSTILDIEKFLHIPVRKLSLGQRMKCEVAAALLHNPKIIFLDEPTIGLDAVARENIIRFVKQINTEFKTTVFLTTHYTSDVEELCKKIIVLDRGKKVYHGKLYKFKDKYMKEKVIEIEIDKIKSKKLFEKVLDKSNSFEVHGNYYKMNLPIKIQTPSLISNLMKACDLIDFTVTEPKLEKIIAEMYREVKK